MLNMLVMNRPFIFGDKIWIQIFNDNYIFSLSSVYGHSYIILGSVLEVTLKSYTFRNIITPLELEYIQTWINLLI